MGRQAVTRSWTTAQQKKPITYLLFEVSCMYVCYLLFPINNNNNNNNIAKQIVMRTVSTLCVSGIHDRRFLITIRLRTAQNRPLVHRIRIGLTNWIVVFCVERQI